MYVLQAQQVVDGMHDLWNPITSSALSRDAHRS